MVKKYDRAFLEKVAEELNDVMALKPAIEVTMPDDETLLEHIKYEATGGGKEKAAIRALDFENPEDPKAPVFSEKVADFLVEIGVWDRDEERVIMPKKSSEKEASAEEKPVSDAKTEKKADEKDAKSETKEEKMSTKKPAVKKDAKKPAAKTTEKKAAAKKPVVKKAAASKEPKGPSNKLLVFQAWKHGKGETDVAKLVKHVKGGVTEGTVRGWISGWGKGKNLPGGIKK